MIFCCYVNDLPSMTRSEVGGLFADNCTKTQWVTACRGKPPTQPLLIILKAGEKEASHDGREECEPGFSLRDQLREMSRETKVDGQRGMDRTLEMVPNPVASCPQSQWTISAHFAIRKLCLGMAI